MFSTVLLLLGLAQSAQQGKYEVSLRLPADGLFSAEEMQIEFTIKDKTREDPLMGFEPVIRAKIESRIDMPSMPGMPVIRETSHPEGVPGDYGLHPTFVHGGDYRLVLNITPPGDAPFTVEFPLKVGDPRPNRPKLANPYKLKLSGNELRIEGPEGPVQDFDIVHEKNLHLIVVSRDLRFFAHLHPAYDGKGVFRIEDPLPPGELHLFADFAPRGKGGQIAMLPRKQGGKAPDVADTLTQPARLTGDFLAGKTTQLTLEDALPVSELQPYLGALAHLILIHEDAETYVHSHPIDDPARIVFLARPPKPGKYKGWVEVQSHGQVLRKSFRLETSGARR